MKSETNKNPQKQCKQQQKKMLQKTVRETK